MSVAKEPVLVLEAKFAALTDVEKSRFITP